MGECSAVNAIKSVMKGTPSFCMRGLKISEHLGLQLKKLGIDYGKKEAEMDIIAVSCDRDKINVILGECKVLDICHKGKFDSNLSLIFKSNTKFEVLY